jgi:RNA polymerase sigma-70 factor (ECF subfamily)
LNQNIYNEPELLLQLQNGREDAFAQLFNVYKGNIYTVAYKFLKSPVLAEEIVQDVFLKVWLKRNEMALIKDFNAYLFIMARNFIFDRLKKAAYEVNARAGLNDQPLYTDDAEYLVRQHQCQQLLQLAIQQLPPQQKQVYLLAKEQGLSHDKIAEQMNLSRLTVKTHMAKALQAIRRYLNANYAILPWLFLFL